MAREKKERRGRDEVGVTRKKGPNVSSLITCFARMKVFCFLKCAAEVSKVVPGMFLSVPLQTRAR